LHDRAVRERIPVHGAFELTFRCNLRCQHCYVSPGNQGFPGKNELTLAEIRGILDQIVDAGCLWLLLTGGDPLVRRDFRDIYLSARRKGLILTLFTNGTLLTPRLADFLAEWRPYVIEITLYGHTQATYERVTGVPGSHARCLRGIELLMERGLPLRLKTVLLSLNQHELWDMKDFAGRLGLSFRYDGLVNAGFNDLTNPLSLRLAPQEVVWYDVEDPQKRKDWIDTFTRLSQTRLVPNQIYRCMAGLSTFNIDPFGQLSLCMLERVPSYDLRQGSFIDGWRNFLAGLRAREFGEDYECGQCSLRGVCAQCPGWARVETGNPEGRVDFLCQVTHERARIFGSTT
jgi:radical SAM protein with 4Fe4S-binding SPASM domain